MLLALVSFTSYLGHMDLSSRILWAYLNVEEDLLMFRIVYYAEKLFVSEKDITGHSGWYFTSSYIQHWIGQNYHLPRNTIDELKFHFEGFRMSAIEYNDVAIISKTWQTYTNVFFEIENCAFREHCNIEWFVHLDPIVFDYGECAQMFEAVLNKDLTLLPQMDFIRFDYYVYIMEQLGVYYPYLSWRDVKDYIIRMGYSLDYKFEIKRAKSYKCVEALKYLRFKRSRLIK